MIAGNKAQPGFAIDLVPHNKAPVRQFIHRSDSQPIAPIKEFSLSVCYILPHIRKIIEYAAMQGDILAARNDLQRIELQVLYCPHGLRGASDAAPAPSGPQTLFAKDKSSCGLN